MKADPKLIAVEFNNCITNHDSACLASLMTDDHVFIDRDGNVHRSKEFMVNAWIKFFEQFPNYKNTFTRIESREDRAVMLGYAYWSEPNRHDPAIWTAEIVGGLVAEWHIYYDTAQNRRRFGLT